MALVVRKDERLKRQRGEFLFGHAEIPEPQVHPDPFDKALDRSRGLFGRFHPFQAGDFFIQKPAHGGELSRGGPVAVTQDCGIDRGQGLPRVTSPRSMYHLPIELFKPFSLRCRRLVA